MTAHNEPVIRANPPLEPKRIIAVSPVSHTWIKEQAAAETQRRGRAFTQPEVIERLILHWQRTGARWEEDPGNGLCTDDQRWQVMQLFAARGITDLTRMRAAITAILALPGPLTDLRNLSRADAGRLIDQLLADEAAGQVNRE